MRRLSSWVAALLIAISCALPACAHEVQPAVADLVIEGDRVRISIEMALEAPLAGIDLAGLEDTNEAATAGEYDALRALPPDTLERLFREAWPEFAPRLTLRAGGATLVPDLDGLDIPEVGDTDLLRISTLRISAALPPGDTPVAFGWNASLGGLIVRQMGVENGYAAFLPDGTLSDPIPRRGPSVETGLHAFLSYVAVGFDHIVPKGLDHILFVLGLFFLALRLRPLLTQVTAFTAAHTVTLALGALDIVRIPPSVVEPLIAASIAYVGIENVLSRGMQPWRPVVVFCFGLLHGLGFASVLTDFGLGHSHFVAKLIGFNIGVELGQLSVIAAAFLLVGSWVGRKPWYKRHVADPISIVIALVGIWWVLERTVFA